MTIAIDGIAINSLLGATSIFIMLVLTFYAWSRQDTIKRGRIFTLLMLCEAIEVAGYTLEIVSPDVSMALTAAKIQYIGVFSVLLWFVFTLNFAGYGVTAERVGRLLAVVPTVIVALAFTNELHGLIWRDISVLHTDAFNVFQAEYGPFFAVYFVFTVVLLVTGVVVLVRAHIRQWRLYRLQMVLWLAGTLIPAFGQYAMVFGWYLIEGIHPIPLSYMIGTAFLTIAVFRLRLVEVMPVPYETIFTSSPNPVIVFDLKRRVLVFNPAAKPFVNGALGDVIGLPLAQAFPELASALGDQLAAENIHFSGADYKVRVAPSVTRAGTVRGHILILTDITLIRQAEREQQALITRISRLEELKTEMIRMGAHDLKTPLGLIKSYLDLVREEDPAAPLSSVQRYLEHMDRAAGNILQIVNDIFSLDRIERMAAEQTMTQVDLTPLVKETAEGMSRSAADKQLTYSVSFGEVLLTVCGDSVQLREAVTNLIGNAIKYTPRGGEVRVRLYAEDEDIVFVVTDTGIGIPADLQSKLFHPFARIRSKETAQIEGTGLGLYLVKGIVERHSGALIVQSEHGQGSTFGFRLPKYREAE